MPDTLLQLFPPETEDWDEQEDLDALLPEVPNPLNIEKEDSSSPLVSLPGEMLVQIASFLSKEQLGAMRVSCKAFCRAADIHLLHSISLSTSSLSQHSMVRIL